MLTAETKQRRAVPPAMQASVDAALAAARAEGYKAGHADAVAQANADNTIAPRTYSLQQVHAAVAAARAEAKAEAYKQGYARGRAEGAAIISSEPAKGRFSLAVKLASDPGVSVEEALRQLAAAPIEKKVEELQPVMRIDDEHIRTVLDALPARCHLTTAQREDLVRTGLEKALAAFKADNSMKRFAGNSTQRELVKHWDSIETGARVVLAKLDPLAPRKIWERSANGWAGTAIDVTEGKMPAEEAISVFEKGIEGLRKELAAVVRIAEHVRAKGGLTGRWRRLAGRSDYEKDNLVDAIIRLYIAATCERPAYRRDKYGDADGPFIKFALACVAPLENDAPSREALAHRLRALV